MCEVEGKDMPCLSFADEVVIKVNGAELRYSRDGVSIINKEKSTPAPQEGNLEDIFEIDVTSLVRNLGRNIAKLIAKGIVQDHYNGDWNKVRFIGLGEELPLSPRLQLSEELGAV